MIAYITGTLQDFDDKSCIVLTPGGVGYKISLPAHTIKELPEKKEQISLHTSLAVREDAMELFGFSTLEERLAFEILRGISKVGSRTALAILSQYRPAELQSIIEQENIPALSRVPGIGAKTAQHIYLELRYKLKPFRKMQGTQATQAPGVLADTVAALINLGYDEGVCSSIVARIIKEEPDLDMTGAIRKALKELSRSRD